MSENPVRSASEEAAKKFKSVAGFINPKTDAGTLADLIESHLAPVVAAAEEAMRDKCEAECEVIMQSREEGDAKGISAANLCAMAISLIPTGTALAEYVEQATKEKEIGIAAHIRGGALDGCQCEPCISVREIVERATEELRADEQKALRAFYSLFGRLAVTMVCEVSLAECLDAGIADIDRLHSEIASLKAQLVEAERKGHIDEATHILGHTSVVTKSIGADWIRKRISALSAPAKEGEK